jgi:hypothetical protein
MEQIYGGGPPIRVSTTIALTSIQLNEHATIHPWRNNTYSDQKKHRSRQDLLFSRAKASTNGTISICLDQSNAMMSHLPASNASNSCSTNSHERDSDGILRMKNLPGDNGSVEGSEDAGSVVFSDVVSSSTLINEGRSSEDTITRAQVGGVRAIVEGYERRRERRPSIAAKGMKSGMQTVFVVKVAVGGKHWKIYKRYK